MDPNYWMFSPLPFWDHGRTKSHGKSPQPAETDIGGRAVKNGRLARKVSRFKNGDGFRGKKCKNNIIVTQK